ncbi:MAG: NusG domain II-containing protein [Clostridia bacterium]|nr:NusG domain II-containing protein [Clostridia bacterium]
MKFIKRTDFIIIAVILLVSFISIGAYVLTAGDSHVYAEIYLESDLIKTIDLSEGLDRHFSIEARPNVVFHQTADGRIRFEDSDCPDKVCINAGYLSISGQFAACLPNGLILKIVGGDKNEETPDMVVGNQGGSN